MREYLQVINDVFKGLKTGEEGLTSADARERLEKNGKNKLNEAKSVSLLVRLLNQLKDPMVLVLIAAAIVSAITAIYANESFADVIII